MPFTKCRLVINIQLFVQKSSKSTITPCKKLQTAVKMAGIEVDGGAVDDQLHVGLYMNIHICRRGHRQRSGKVSERGSCQTYSGQICNHQLRQRSVFVQHDSHQGVTEKLLAGKRHVSPSAIF